MNEPTETLAKELAANIIDAGDPTLFAAGLDRLVDAGLPPSVAYLALDNAITAALDSTEDDQLLGTVDLQQLLATLPERDVLVEPLIGRGHVTAFVGPKASGKSWLALQIAAALATGRPVFEGAAATEPVHVVYLDWENSKRTTNTRLQALGYTAEDDLTNLHYCLFPEVGPLTTLEGGTAVHRLVQAVGAKVVVLDTLARALGGDETNEAVSAFWTNFLMGLKRLGCTVILLDHTGHDETHARGASTKGQLWEAEFLITGRDSFDRTELHSQKDREGWFPQRVALGFDREDGGFYLAQHFVTEEVSELSRQLDLAGAPTDLGKKPLREWLRADGWEVIPGNDLLQAAISHRKRTTELERVEQHFGGPKAA